MSTNQVRINGKVYPVAYVARKVAALREFAAHWEKLGYADRARQDRNMADSLEARIG